MARFGRRERLRVSSPDDVRRVPEARNALTASGLRVRAKSGDALRRLVQPWQQRSFAYYDMLGEIKYAAQFYSRGLSQLRLFAAVKDENGDLVEIDMTDLPEGVAHDDAQAATDALNRIQDPGGGQSGLLGAYGRLMFLTGEALLFVSRDEDDEEQWEMLSTDEIRVQGNTIERIKAPSLQAEQFKEAGGDNEESWEVVQGQAVTYRLWQRHPRYSMLADSTMQGVLDLCEELVLLTQSVRSRTRSRLAGAGILWISDRISPAPPEPSGDEDPEEDILLADLTEAMTTPIADEGSASAVVPIIVRIPHSALEGPEGAKTVRDLVHHMQLVDPMQLYPETGLRYELIQRIAIGLDMPPEVLMGKGDANHWSAWQINEDTWQGHLQPKAQQLVDDLTASYFRPELKAVGIVAFKEFFIGYDATAIINHPDRTKDAKDLHKAMAISDKALRESGGFDEEDAITEPEELQRRIGVQVGDGYLALTGEVSQATDINRRRRVEEEDNTVDGGTSSPETVKDRPEQPEQPAAETAAANGHQEEAIARILGAADLALLRARESAGNRLRSLAKRDPELQDIIRDVRTGSIAAVLGRERVRAMRAPSDAELVSGARDLLIDTLRVYGITDEAVVERITENFERHVARTLYDERPAPLSGTFGNYVAAITAHATTPV